MPRKKVESPEVSQNVAAHVEIRAIDGLVAYARNARTHDEVQVSQLMASMVEWGFTNPVLADADGIIAGHGRVMAARRLYEQGKTIKLPNGRELPPGTVPVIDVSGWSEAKRRAYILADNQLATKAGWNFDMLAIELEELRGLDFDIDLVGFSVDELADITATDSPPPERTGQENLAAGSDGSRSGVTTHAMKFGANEVSVTLDELATLEGLLKRYVEQFGVTFSFAAWLCEGRADA